MLKEKLWNLTVRLLTQSIRPYLTPALFLSSTRARNAPSAQIFSKEIMKFQKWLGRGTLNHPSAASLWVSPGEPGPSWCPPVAPLWAWGKHLLHWAPFIRNVCFEGTLHLYQASSYPSSYLRLGGLDPKKRGLGDCLKHFLQFFVPFGLAVISTGL